MVAFAYSECGLSIEQFFRLSWYEWSLEILRVKARRKRDFTVWEGQASLIREHMALMANFNRDTKKRPQPFKGSDFIKLSFDEKEEEQERKIMSPEEVEAKFGKFLIPQKNGE